jgi:hypothetical protein
MHATCLKATWRSGGQLINAAERYAVTVFIRI